jgi:hypothetical protein
MVRPGYIIVLLALLAFSAHANILGIHTMIQDNGESTQQLDQAAELCGWGGWVKQLMYVQDGTNWGFDPKWTAFVDGARARHLNVVARLHYLPPFCRADAANFASKPKSDADGSFTSYKNLIRGFVSRFNGRLHYIEIWNEPNLGYEWNTYPNAEEFVKVMMAGYDGAKEADPACRVLFPGLAPTGGTADNQNVNNLTFLRTCFQSTYKCPRDGRAFRDHFDILGNHSYALNHPATFKADKYSVYGYTWELNVCAEFGVAPPVLITECGYALGNRDDTSMPAVTEQSRANDMVIAFRDVWAKDPRVLGAMSYFLHAIERTSDQPFFWVRDDGTRTPQFVAVKALKPILSDFPGNLVNRYGNLRHDSAVDRVSVVDAVAIAQVAVSTSPSPEPYLVTAADVAPSGAPDDMLTLADAVRVMRFASGLEAAPAS